MPCPRAVALGSPPATVGWRSTDRPSLHDLDRSKWKSVTPAAAWTLKPALAPSNPSSQPRNQAPGAAWDWPQFQAFWSNAAERLWCRANPEKERGWLSV